MNNAARFNKNLIMIFPLGIRRYHCSGWISYHIYRWWVFQTNFDFKLSSAAVMSTLNLNLNDLLLVSHYISLIGIKMEFFNWINLWINFWVGHRFSSRHPPKHSLWRHIHNDEWKGSEKKGKRASSVTI